MKVLIPPIYERSSHKDDPFANDLFQRKSFADNLSRLFDQTNDGLVIAVNSKWGNGKTSFIHFWKNRINTNSKFITIYYDAFKNDYSEDAFLSIASSIQESLEKKLELNDIDSKSKKQLEKLKKNSKDVSKGLIKTSVGYATRFLSSIVISDPKILEDIESFSKKILFDTLEDDVDERFDAYISQKSLVKEYQDTLKEILKSDNDKQLKIIFFVDELDRCRPNFSIQVIEKIKHLFNINNVFFVLTINKEQLLNTISSVYGLERDDSNIYLQKFIHLETNLPPMHGLNPKDEIKVLTSYIENLLSYCEINNKYGRENDSFLEFIDLCSSSKLNMNPRGIERTISLIALAIGSNLDKNISPLIDFIAPMAALKISNPQLYATYQDGKFHSTPGEIRTNTYYSFFKKLFRNDLDEKASNAFEVTKVRDACRILNVYNFPGNVERTLHIHKKDK